MSNIRVGDRVLAMTAYTHQIVEDEIFLQAHVERKKKGKK